MLKLVFWACFFCHDSCRTDQLSKKFKSEDYVLGGRKIGPCYLHFPMVQLIFPLSFLSAMPAVLAGSSACPQPGSGSAMP